MTSYPRYVPVTGLRSGTLPSVCVRRSTCARARLTRCTSRSKVPASFGKRAATKGPPVPPVLGLRELLQFDVERGQMAGCLFTPLPQPFPAALELVDLGLDADDIVLQMGGVAHLFEMLGLVGLHLIVQLGQALHRGMVLLLKLGKAALLLLAVGVHLVHLCRSVLGPAVRW